MKNLMVIAAVIGLIMLAQGAFAASATSNLSWTPPETRVDGTPMTTGEIAEYRIFYSVDGTATTASENVVSITTGETTSESITLDLVPRAEKYVVSFIIVVVDNYGLQSQPSEPVSKAFDVGSTANPGPVTNVQFTITCGNGCTVEEVVDDESDTASEPVGFKGF